VNQSATIEMQGAAVAFDRMASSYDAVFTESVIGRAQRRVVWDALQRAFQSGDRVLELNCGTGEDALFLATRGVSVVACDAAPAMIEVARKRQATLAPAVPAEFHLLRNEDIAALGNAHSFDGVLSNFSGLNCVADLPLVAGQMSDLVRTGGAAVICMSSRVCLWEIAWYGGRANFAKAFRRVRGKTVAHLDGLAVPVWYPKIREIARAFSPWFQLRAVRAVGLFVPPSYVENWARNHRKTLRLLQAMDRTSAAWPLLRGMGDHVLLEFVRTPA
jgi:ubiquinone/menaquinone biosynthesis C-methylase UbiE